MIFGEFMEKSANFLQSEVGILNVDTRVEWREVVTCAETCYIKISCSNDAANCIYAISVSDRTKNIEEGIPNIGLNPVD